MPCAKKKKKTFRREINSTLNMTCISSFILKTFKTKSLTLIKFVPNQYLFYY